jgi:uncharacterized protein YegP (UPF0339 family)
MSAEFVLREHKDGTFGFVFQTEHGQVLLTSRSYGDADTALNRLRSARQMARKERNYELRTADEGGFYFVVKNRSKEVLGFSQRYPDPESMRQGMTLTRGCSHGARVENPFKAHIKAHLKYLHLKNSSHTLDTPFSCPQCGNAMVLKIAKRPKPGLQPGETFWGCSKYPRCKGFLNENLAAKPEPQPFSSPIMPAMNT